MGKVTPIIFARLARRRHIVEREAVPFLTNMLTELSRPLPFVLVAGKDLDLGWAHYSGIVSAAKGKGYTLAPPKLVFPLAVSGPEFPIVLVGMMPKYERRIGSLLRVSNMERAKCAYVDVENFSVLQSFSPHVVFAFLK